MDIANDRGALSTAKACTALDECQFRDAQRATDPGSRGSDSGINEPKLVQLLADAMQADGCAMGSVRFARSMGWAMH
jgi:hypothetical protein